MPFKSIHVTANGIISFCGWALKNWCFWAVVLEKTLESPLDCKEIQPAHSEDQPWDFFGRNDAKAETPVLWPPYVKSWLIGKDWCWEGLGAGGEGDDRGWDGWMASPTRWTWVWVNSGSWWWTGRPGVLWFMGSQRVGHDWATELNWDMGRGNKGDISWILLGYKTEDPENPLLFINGPNPEINTWSDLSVRTFTWSGMRLPAPCNQKKKKKRKGHEISPKYGKIYDYGEGLWKYLLPY